MLGLNLNHVSKRGQRYQGKDKLLHSTDTTEYNHLALQLMPDSHCGWTPFYFMYDPKCSTAFPWCMIDAPSALAWCTIYAPSAFAWCTINAPAAFAWCTINAAAAFAWCTINASVAFACCTINAPAAFSWCPKQFVHWVEFLYIGWNGVHPLWFLCNMIFTKSQILQLILHYLKVLVPSNNHMGLHSTWGGGY